MGNEKPQLTEAFAKALSGHGYGFQYAVMEQISSLSDSNKSFWYPWVPEFPVEIKSSGTRIDLILRHRTRPLFLICECKRANPALANWCFARTPRPGGMPFASRNFVETVHRKDGRPTSGMVDLSSSKRIYQIGIEVRTDQKGDTHNSGRGEIESAATQVCRGLNGLIEFVASRHESLMEDNGYLAFIPAIITTAQIYATEASIASADLNSGNISDLNPPLEAVDWIWYEYPQSPGIKHSVPYVEPSNDLQVILFQEFIRRIAVIGVSGLEYFLNMTVWEH